MIPTVYYYIVCIQTAAERNRDRETFIYSWKTAWLVVTDDNITGPTGVYYSILQCIYNTTMQCDRVPHDAVPVYAMKLLLFEFFINDTWTPDAPNDKRKDNKTL